ncbi:thioredoxin [Citrobacter sp. BNK-42]|uniref:thioredoxin n=1 Tax=Citrobacter sp. BNK-42 TaxID=3376175 RepID=UPI003B51027C
MKPTELTVKNFDEKMSNGRIAVVRFWAVWCAPCRMVAPTFEKLAEQMSDKAFFGEVNIDQAPELAERYGIRSIPTTLVLKEGERIDGMVGVASLSGFTEMVERSLKV